MVDRGQLGSTSRSAQERRPPSGGLAAFTSVNSSDADRAKSTLPTASVLGNTGT